MALDNFTINNLGSFQLVFAQIIEKYKLSARHMLILNCVKRIILGQMELDEFIELLQKELQLDFLTASQVAYELKTNILDKTAEAAALKQRWQEEEKTAFDPQVLVNEVLNKAGLEFTDQQLKNRFDNAVYSWLKDKSDDEELKDILTKSQKVGGIELPEDAFMMLYNLLVEKKAQTKAKNIDTARVIADYEATHQVREILPSEPAQVIIGEEIMKKYSPDNIANEFLTKLNYKITNPNLKKRYDEVILSWLRDIRDIPELKEVMTRSAQIGGLGMPLEVFDRLDALLVGKKAEIKKANVNISQIIANYAVASKSVEAMPAVAEEEIDVAAKATGVAVTQEKPTGQEVTIDQLLKEKGIPYQELAAKEAIKRQLGERERVPEVQGELAKEITAKEEFLESKEEIEPPAVPVPSSEPFQSVPFQPEPLVQPEPQMPAPAETKFEVKQPMIRKTMPEMRPRVEDVKFTSQLVGPIDELAVLKIEDFRRLAKEPEIAAKKIMAKLELLEEESLTKKAEGIKALKSSPLYKVYSDIMNQAIKEGKSIEQVTEENPIITMAEFKAIMELNKSLKY